MPIFCLRMLHAGKVRTLVYFSAFSSNLLLGRGRPSQDGRVSIIPYIIPTLTMPHLLRHHSHQATMTHVIIFWKLRENGTNVESSLGPLKTVCRSMH
jgi:hypothetical protein